MTVAISPDFTESRYRAYLKSAIKKFSVMGVNEALNTPNNNICVWRHDIDISPQRALRLANIEAEVGIKSTYYVQLRSFFYNLLETTVLKCILEISKLGHEIGLHFDPYCYQELSPANDSWIVKLMYETNLLQNEIQSQIKTFSFHNPVKGGWNKLSITEVNGIKYSYDPKLANFPYCSDSSGSWRNLKLDEVLKDPNITNLYVLTHAEWWTDQELTVDQKIDRAISGRKNDALKHWNELIGSKIY